MFSNLSLLRISDRSGLEPDYSKSTSEVYKGLIVLDLNLTHGLRLVSQCELGESKVKALPSWVPDFTRSRKSTRLWDFGGSSGSKAHAVVQNESVMITTGCRGGDLHLVALSRRSHSTMTWTYPYKPAQHRYSSSLWNRS